MSKNIEYFLRLSLLIVCAIFVQLYLFEMKDIFHIDELLSFEQANSENGLKLFKHGSDIDNKLIKSDFFINYLVQSDSFTFAKMWENLKYDTHMPLYFILLFIASSFFTTEFSSTPGILINIFCLIFLLYTFYKLIENIFKNKEIALASTFLFAFTSPVLGLEIFIRMYLLQMLLATLLLKSIYNFIFNKNVSKYSLIYVVMISSLTILTHFYSILFCFFVTLSGFVILIKQKRHLDNFKFCLCMLLSVLCSYLVYPEMLDIGLHGERGSQFWAIFSNYYENPFPLLKQQITLFIKPLFKNSIIFFCAISFFILIIFKAHKNMFITEHEKQTILFFTIIFFLFGIFLALIMPNMSTFQIRYLAPIVPIYIILIIYTILYIIKNFTSKKMIIYYVLWSIAFFNAFYQACNQINPFYLRSSILTKKLDNMVVGSDIWWGLGGGDQHSWILQNYIDKLMTANEIWTLVDYDSKEFKNFSDQEIKKKRYAYLLMPKTQEQQPQGAIEWIKKTTGRQSYYLFTMKYDNLAAMVFEASVFLVCPY